MSIDELDSTVIKLVWSLDHSDEPSSVRRLSGNSHRVYECTSADGHSSIMRLADPSRARFNTEAAIIDRCGAEGLPVPRVLYSGTVDVADQAVAVMVQAKADGVTLTQAAAERGLDRSAELVVGAGELLARIHAIKTTGFGPVDGALHGQAEDFDIWFIDGLATKLESARRIAADASDLVDQAAVLLEQHRPLLQTSEATLCHGDFSPNNILANDDGITAVIDWESAKSGPPGLDIGWWDCFFETPLTPVDALIEGYERITRLDHATLDAVRHLCVLRVMVGHFTWTLSIGDDAGVELARKRLTDEVASAHTWAPN